MRRGFTLVEITISATLLALCIGFVLSVLPAGLFSIRNSEKRDYAGAWAQRILEEHRNTPADVLDAQAKPKNMGQEAYANATFQAFLLVKTPAPGDLHRTLRVTVTWKDKGDQTKSIFRELIVCRSSR